MSDGYRIGGHAEELALDESRGAHGSIWASLVSLSCFLRGLPLFFSATPKTPLRVLCVIAFDTLHVLRRAKPLPRDRRHLLATFLDFAASANATFDDKEFCLVEYELNLQRLEEAGISLSLHAYMRRLRELEERRPSSSEDQPQFDEVRLYREAVVQLSLGVVAVIALGDQYVDDRILATCRDNDLEMLFRIVMQFQIIDDVLDYSEDVAAGLPSFLTASASLPQAIELTASASQNYSKPGELPQSATVFPLRVSLQVVSALTKLIIGRACRRQHMHGSARVQRSRSHHHRTDDPRTRIL